VNRGFVHLLAKSTATPDQPQEHEKLDGHILGVLNAARMLLRLVGNQFLASLALSSEWYNVIDAAVARGALLHDLGKANDQFQRLVRGDKTIQALRHEWVSLDILLQYSELDRWLFPTNDQLIRHAAVCAVVGHHLKRPTFAMVAGRHGYRSWRDILMLTGCCDEPDWPRRLHQSYRTMK
jgi:CRISPR-associated endonuclease Cas3-HD